MAPLPDDFEKVAEPDKVPTPNSEDLAHALLRLEQIDQIVIEQSAIGTTLQNIGRIVNLSAGQVARRREAAIAKLRQILGVNERE